MKTTKASQRAVAPIIATLLMVAISVVGGILIFVFAQDFFTSSSVTSPSIDSLQLFGYDASDAVSLTTHAATTLTSAGGAVNQKVDDGEAFAIYIRNTGANSVIIEDVKIFGTSLTFDTSTTISGTVPGNSKWVLTKGNATAPTTATGNQVINPGEELTLVIGYDEDINGEIKVGRPIPIVIKTGNAAVFTKQIENGIRIG
jgi:FlaG/FlaF family flagellin (archaellin)